MTHWRESMLIVMKAIKVLRIRLGFVVPTLSTKIKMRLWGCRYGPNFRVCGKVHIQAGMGGAIRVGKNVTLNARFLTNTAGMTNPVMLECLRDGEIIIGDNTGLSSAVLSAATKIDIGKHVKIGVNVRIFDHDFHSVDYEDRRDRRRDALNTSSSAVVIEDDVLVGANAIILKGVVIGARSIIGAGSVVARSVPADSIAAGNPARIVRSFARQCSI